MGMSSNTSVSEQDIWLSLSESDRLEVASRCFQTGFFGPDGDLRCYHAKRQCLEEYLCEVIACLILMPEADFLSHWHLRDRELAARYQVPRWSVRFWRANLRKKAEAEI